MRDRLQEIMDQATDRITISNTVPITLEHVTATLSAAEETLMQLSEASRELPGGGAAVFAAAPTPMERVQEIANRFPSVVARMKKRRSTRQPLEITDEYDVQYLFQALLGVPFLDVRPEEPTPSVASGSGRADTLLKPERIVVEYKCTRHNLGPRSCASRLLTISFSMVRRRSAIGSSCSSTIQVRSWKTPKGSRMTSCGALTGWKRFGLRFDAKMNRFNALGTAKIVRVTLRQRRKGQSRSGRGSATTLTLGAVQTGILKQWC